MWVFFLGLILYVSNTVNGAPSKFCAFYSLPGPPLFHVQNFSLTLYPVNKKLCPVIDPERDVLFQLYTRSNPNEPQVLQLGNDHLLESSYMDFSNPTVIFFHGFTESFQADDAQLIRSGFLTRANYNVILVQAERLLAGIYYIDAVINCKYIGKYGAQFIDYLVGRGMDLQSVHVIGMSLGAQISGFVGQYLTTGKLPRITGLDPAGPLYNKSPEDERLDPSDAQFVDVIHSNKGVFGYKYSCGHVDFWPNGGGKIQPGCSLIERISRRPKYLNEFVFCDHFRAYRLFARSLTDPYRYEATKCTNYIDYKEGKCDQNEKAFMGIAVDERNRGDFYIDTGLDADGYGH